MGKWIGGIIGGVIGGAILWILTNRFFPVWFADPPVEAKYRVECSLTPTTVSPGQSAEVFVKVTRDNEPLEGVELEVGTGGGMFGSGGSTVSGHTLSGGVFRSTWTPPATARGLGYLFNVIVRDVVSTDLDASYRRTGAHTQCLLSVAN